MARAALVPVVALAGLPVAFAILRQSHCLSQGWVGVTPFWRQCTSQLATDYASAGLGRGLPAYLAGELPLDAPPVSGIVMATLGSLTPQGSLLAEQRWYLALWAVLAVLLVVILVILVADTRGHPDLDPTQVALAPVLALTVLVAPDLVGVVLAMAGLRAWSRDRPALAGALLGVATLAGGYAALVVLAIGLVGWRAGRLGETRTLATAYGFAVAGTTAVLLVADRGIVTRPYAAWLATVPESGSIWSLLGPLRLEAGPGLLTVLAMLGWVLAIALGVLVVGSAQREPSVAQVALLMVSVVLVTGKTFTVQSSLWLVPLVALAGVPWRVWLTWAAAEAAHFVAVWPYLALATDPAKGLPAGWYAVFLLGRVVAVAWLGVRVWRELTEPVLTPWAELAEEADREVSATRAEPSPEGAPTDFGGGRAAGYP